MRPLRSRIENERIRMKEERISKQVTVERVDETIEATNYANRLVELIESCYERISDDEIRNVKCELNEERFRFISQGYIEDRAGAERTYHSYHSRFPNARIDYEFDFDYTNDHNDKRVYYVILEEQGFPWPRLLLKSSEKIINDRLAEIGFQLRFYKKEMYPDFGIASAQLSDFTIMELSNGL